MTKGGVAFTVKRERRASLTIQVQSSGDLLVKAPHFVSEEQVAAFVKSKERWIQRRMKSLTAYQEYKSPAVIKDGVKVAYLGQIYSLRCELGKSIQIAFDKNDCVFSFPEGVTNDLLLKKLEKWLKDQARDIFEDRMAMYAKQLNVFPKKLFIKHQKSRWGSCSSAGNINLNWTLIKTPLEIIDYVVVHELCHLIHMDHSKAFWNCVASIIPDWKKKRDWLKERAIAIH